ncbi:hypothetical protein K461DRAFT_274951 [Myriangium duriaei CBS 260.36]|uniref:Uncharacterized protein n=1 Tax=Myriangium duriaei CBS 260.36 TaxID=1168546 RepID=A0A9P4J709_9PEZI|nr:hypothetical protein K461DRAFT_274951 [Myriangium duriaei CBS 260.36]
MTCSNVPLRLLACALSRMFAHSIIKPLWLLIKPPLEVYHHSHICIEAPVIAQMSIVFEGRDPEPKAESPEKGRSSAQLIAISRGCVSNIRTGNKCL